MLSSTVRGLAPRGPLATVPGELANLLLDSSQTIVTSKRRRGESMMSVSRLKPKLVSFLCCSWIGEYILVHAWMYVYTYLTNVDGGCVCTPAMQDVCAPCKH